MSCFTLCRRVLRRLQEKGQCSLPMATHRECERSIMHESKDTVRRCRERGDSTPFCERSCTPCKRERGCDDGRESEGYTAWPTPCECISRRGQDGEVSVECARRVGWGRRLRGVNRAQEQHKAAHGHLLRTKARALLCCG